jgi:hypothetical protein
MPIELSLVAGWVGRFGGRRRAHLLVTAGGRPVGNALGALGAAAAATTRRFGISSQHAWQLVVHLSDGQLLAAPSG